MENNNKNKNAHSEVLDRVNRSHVLFQRKYSRNSQLDPQHHASDLLSWRRKREQFIANRIDTTNIHATHDELDLLGEMYTGSGWKHDNGYQIQVIFHGNGNSLHLSSAKVGHTIQDSLERNYESLLMQYAICHSE